MGHDKHLPEDFFDLTRAEQEYCHEVAYFEEYGRCCNPLRESIRQQVMGKISDADVKEMNLWLISEGAKAGLNKASAEALNKFVLNQAIAKSIVAATVKGSIDSVGRRGAIIVTGNTVKYSMAVGGHAAFNGVKMEAATIFGPALGFAPAISASVGAALAETAAVQIFGSEAYVAKNVAGFMGAAAGGAIAGACVGGPVGAAAGAAVGVVGNAMTIGIKALCNTGFGFKGPNDNWCFINCRTDGEEVRFRTYKSNDSWRIVAYWSETKSSDAQFVMSAGQGKSDSFQVYVDFPGTNKDDSDLKKVYYRDVVMTGKDRNGHQWVIHLKGDNWENTKMHVERDRC